MVLHNLVCFCDNGECDCIDADFNEGEEVEKYEDPEERRG